MGAQQQAAGAPPQLQGAMVSAAQQEQQAAAGDAAGGDGGFTPTAFVCQNFTCQAPTSDADKVYELLSRQGGAAAVKLQPVKL